MGEWYTNPVVWIGAITAFVIVGRVVFQVGQWKGEVNTDRATFKQFMAEIGEKLDKIQERIDAIFGRLPPPKPVASGSPLRLTALGQAISEELGVTAWATETAPNLCSRAQGKTAYKVQEMCFEYAQSEWEPSDEWDARIDDCAYSRGMERKNVLDVFAVELRNRLLAQLGIPEE